MENNVSTTPLDAITAPLKGPYAYNNTPSDFTVRDNGSAWVAQAGATRYATLAGAFATAPDHSTIKLVSSVSEQPTLSVSDGRELTLDLAGFNLFFATDGGLSLRDGALTVTGQGDVATAEGADGKPEPLATVSGTGSLALKGGQLQSGRSALCGQFLRRVRPRRRSRDGPLFRRARLNGQAQRPGRRSRWGQDRLLW